MRRLTRDGTAEPVSRDQILRHARGQGDIIFPVQLTTSRIGNLTRLIHTLLYVMTIHTYIHTGEKTGKKKIKVRVNVTIGYTLVKTRHGRVPTYLQRETDPADWSTPTFTLPCPKNGGVYPAMSTFP